MTNLTENRLNQTFTAVDLAAIDGAIATILEKLPMVSLTDTQRMTMKHINVRNKVFVEDAIYQLNANGPGVIAPFVSAEAMQTDLILYEQADQIKASCDALMQRLLDIQQVAGHELYSSALAAYKVFEQAGRAGIPNAKTAHEALKRRFSRQGRTVGS